MNLTATCLAVALLTASAGATLAQTDELPETSAAPAGAPERAQTPQEIMSGPWRLSGLGGAPLCEFELNSDAKGRAGTLTVKPGCVGEWRTKDIARWTLRGKDLTLWGRNNQPVRSFRKVTAVTFENREAMNQYMGRGEMLFFGKTLED